MSVITTRNEVSTDTAERNRTLPGGWHTFNAFPPDGYSGIMFVFAALRLGDHAHVEVQSGRWLHGPSGGTCNTGIAGRLILRWPEWIAMRDILDATTPWRIAEVENPTDKQLKHQLKHHRAAGSPS